VSGATLFGLCGAALVGIGLWGLICQPGALRKILAFNLLGSGVFLLFGVIARRGGGALSVAGAGVDSDPVPQALIITGLVVAFAATALGVTLLRRFAEESGRSTLEDAAPASGESTSRGEP
jgi:multicomponent Na+:H+ antiporter subunit C